MYTNKCEQELRQATSDCQTTITTSGLLSCSFVCYHTISHKDGQHSIRWKQDMVGWLIEYFPPGNLFLYLREQSRANERCGINDIIYKSPNVFIDLPNTRSFSESKAETKNMRNGLVVPFWVSSKGANCLNQPTGCITLAEFKCIWKCFVNGKLRISKAWIANRN